MLIYWLQGAILIAWPCGADLPAPGCYFDRLALWCWVGGSGCRLTTHPVVLICWLRGLILVDNLGHRHNLYRPALWCWLYVVPAPGFYFETLALRCWFVGFGMLGLLTILPLIWFLIDQASGVYFCGPGCFLIDWPCGVDLLAPGCW